MQLKFPFALWTAAMVREMIAKQFRVRLSHSSVCRLLGQMGLSVQWRAYQQDPEAVRRWKEEEYPRGRRYSSVTRPAAGPGGDGGRHPSCPPRGAIQREHHLRHQRPRAASFHDGRVTAAVFIEFLKRLLVNAPSPIFLIVDGQPTHKAKAVKRFIEKQDGDLELYYLPPYSPELNPDELVWNDLKNKALGRKVILSKEALRNLTLSHLHRLQRLRLISSFFLAPTTLYASS